EFDTFGLAFKESRSERADTIVDGNLVVDWPSDTDIPLREMQVCDCGMPDGARTPEVLLEKKLRYWDAAFSPYGVTFSPDSVPDCPGGTLASSTCPQDGIAESAQSAAID